MPNTTLPEIKRVNLTSTLLTLKSMKIDDVLGFDFLDKPDTEQLEAALKQLYLLKAIDIDGRMRTIGYELAKFPLEPSYGKALLAAKVVSRYCE